FSCVVWCFFFQAEDGIRDRNVTGVQTCALPIYRIIIGIMYGSNWNNSIICFKLLAISIATQMMNSSSGAAFQALGNTKLLFIQGCINTTVTVFSILIGIFSGKTIYALALWIDISFIL